MIQTSFIKNSKTGLIIFFCTVTILYMASLTPASEGAYLPKVTDITISSAVKDELSMDKLVQSGQIDVTTTDGVVTLKGKVSNILSKERAATIARTVKGVKSVVDEIEVTPPLSPKDSQIMDDVKDALLADPVAKFYKIDVSVKNNIVTLTGKVQTWKEKHLCEEVAMGVRGVTDVINRIYVSWPGKRSDHEIKKEIEEVLKWDASVDNGLIDVNVVHGKVLLRGIVGSAIEKNIATEDSYVKGVKEVNNSGLEVKKWARGKGLRGQKYSKMSVRGIAKAVSYTLRSDPRLAPFKINVEVDPKTHEVKLRGMVNNLLAKISATIMTRKIVGVRKVDNRIKVRPDETVSDTKIKDGIRMAIERDPYLDRYMIGVKVSNGVVKLYGNVGTVFEKSRAEDIAAGINGVTKVDNILIVENFSNTYAYDPWVNDTILYDYYWYQNRNMLPKKSDSEIARNIRHDMFWSPFVNADQVKVKVNEGIATLTGKVDSWMEYDAAMKDAYKGGAVYVKNELKVR